MLTQRRKDAKKERRILDLLCGFAPLREKFFITSSKRQLHARMKNPAFAADRIRNRRVTDRRLVKVKSLVVPPDHLVLEREEIGAHAEITRLAKLSEDL